MSIETIRELVNDSYETAQSKGWHEGPEDVPLKLALMHGEISKALELYRTGRMLSWTTGDKPEGFDIKLADLVIRVCDLAGSLGLHLEEAIERKAAYNKTRPYKHGGKLC
jgi:NTP pyrophosphatase (non-canonical NTP hydrolase)